MDDAINTSSWRQPNTFMDIMSPGVKSPSPRSKPERSNTLMRSVVKKPVPQVEDELSLAEEQASLVNSRPDLSEAARLTDKSPLISRYSPSNVYQQALAMEMSPEAEPVATQSYPSMDSYEAPVITPEASFANSDSQSLAIAQPAPNILSSALETPFAVGQQIKQSASKWKIAKKLSGWSVVGIVAVGVIAGGIFINSNISRVELYLASSRAGFSATLPSIKPSGYDLKGISTASGVIEASFSSNSDSRSYSINEKPSNLSSSDLLGGYVANKAGANYQQINTADNTIYVYNGHDATWVKNGIWYIVQDNNSLSNHQIIDIADSM